MKDRLKILKLSQSKKLDSLRAKRDIISDENLHLLELLCSSVQKLLLDKSSLGLLVDYARFSASSSRLFKLREILRDECSSIIDSSKDCFATDSAKLILGVINFHSGLDKGSLTYFESIKYKAILQEFAFAEYVKTSFKYLDSIQPLTTPNELLSSIDEMYLRSSKNVADLVVAINSCRLMSVAERVIASQHLSQKYLSKEEIEEETTLWAINFLKDSKKSLQSSRDSIKNEEDLMNIGIMDYKMLDKNFCSGNLGDYVQTMASALAWNQALG